jgi:hypothetical protein
MDPKCWFTKTTTAFQSRVMNLILSIIFFRATDVTYKSLNRPVSWALFVTVAVKQSSTVLALKVIIFTSQSLAKRCVPYFTMDPKCWFESIFFRATDVTYKSLNRPVS